MPARTIQFYNGGFYHVFNRTIDRGNIFTNTKEYERFIEAMRFYLYIKSPIRFIQYQRSNVQEKAAILTHIAKLPQSVRILSYCVMPNHFHLLLQQNQQEGISKYVGSIQNGYARYFNTKYNRQGPLFLPRFKAVEVCDDYQLQHVSRYIHLNPYSSRITPNMKELHRYKWSSLPSYLKKVDDGITDTAYIGKSFKNPRDYGEFIIDRADYQRSLEIIKHQIAVS